jgi:acyl-CoA reductase-like NAD-dependent aldehyde dehydrogenase
MAVGTKEPTGLYVGGSWRDGERRLLVHHKYTGAELAHLVEAGPADVDAAVAAARDALARERLPAYRRYRILKEVAERIEAEREVLALTIAREGGKPLKDARAEVLRAVETVTLSAEEAKRIHGETVPLDAAPGVEGKIGVFLRVPVGVVAAITPFNFPLNLVVHKVAPAIAAGCAVVLKPASTTPLTAIRLVELFEQAGLPPGYLNLVLGPGGTVGMDLVRHPDVRMVTFTGSPPVGRRIHEAAGLKKVTLELGNSSANVVHKDADLPRAARLLAQKAFSSAGQFCISVQRIYVHEEVFDAFGKLLAEAAGALVVGDPEDEATDVGPMISEGEARRVESWVLEALDGGARLIAGGTRQGALVPPTLLTDVRADMKVVSQEVFGPVASIVPYRTEEEAIRLVNGTVYGLQAGVFTRDLGFAWRCAQEIEAGGVVVNDTSSFRADLMPYGGVKESGIGREGPRYAVEEMTEVRMVVFHLG